MERRRTLTMNWDGLGEVDDDDERFFETCQRISSAVPLDLASSSDEEDEDYEDSRVSFASSVSPVSSIHSLRAISVSKTGAAAVAAAVVNPDYDVWMAAPGSIRERRKRLLHGMGLDENKESLKVTSVELDRAISKKFENGNGNANANANGNPSSSSSSSSSVPATTTSKNGNSVSEEQKTEPSRSPVAFGDKPAPLCLSGIFAIRIRRVLEFASKFMASTVPNAPFTVRRGKGLDCQNYVGLRASTNLKFNCVRTAIKSRPLHLFVVRASESHNGAGPLKKLGLSDAECEAAVAAGNVPEAPPVPPKPAAPAGTPVVPSIPLHRRPRRNRRSPALRAAFQETNLSPANFVYPLFIHEGEEDTPIGAMPGCYRLGWRHGLVEEVAKARDVGVNSVVLFPKVPDALKSPTGDEAYNENGLVPRAIRLLKNKYPDLVIYTDVALDPYSSDGHDGIVREDGVIMNDETVHQLSKQAVAQARAGADVVSPSDMMDGRIGAIRAALDAEGFQHVSIMSYTAKYASSFYGPFREALDSNPRFGDKKTYQMNPANYREALTEMREDESEGADILLVKPGLPYLDIIRLLRDNSPLPIAAYQVSGEFSMIKAAGALKMIDEERVMMESLLCLRRAGADVILTYFALQAARCLCGEAR